MFVIIQVSVDSQTDKATGVDPKVQSPTDKMFHIKLLVFAINGALYLRTGVGQFVERGETADDPGTNGQSSETRRSFHHGDVRHGHCGLRHRSHDGELLFYNDQM